MARGIVMAHAHHSSSRDQEWRYSLNLIAPSIPSARHFDRRGALGEFVAAHRRRVIRTGVKVAIIAIINHRSGERRRANAKAGGVRATARSCREDAREVARMRSKRSGATHRPKRFLAYVTSNQWRYQNTSSFWRWRKLVRYE